MPLLVQRPLQSDQESQPGFAGPGLRRSLTSAR